MTRRRPPIRPWLRLFVATVGLLGVAAAPVACGGADAGDDDAGADDAGADEAASSVDCDASVSPTAMHAEVIEERPHDPAAFTQGLLMLDGQLYESTGIEGESTIRQVDPDTGEVLRSVDLRADQFGEGLTNIGDDRLVQLTWTDGTALLWDRATFEPLGEHRYDGEGWGITTMDDGRLVMSDGSDTLAVRDPEDFTVIDRWPVTRSNGPADRLNELDWDGTHLWANRWKTDEIVRIEPRCRRVDGVVDAADLTDLAAQAAGGQPIDVLNGIAHVPGTDRFLVTGKDWPVMFEVRFVPS